ncbi:MAG: DUF763 domain-containing protein [Endomicrobiia bacterium]
MKHTYADMPLHSGKAPKWLFERQKKILFEIGRIVILEFGTEEFLRRISDPVWFQVLGCISGFDWHSSGVTTTVTSALKEMFNKNPEYGIYIFGGKGKVAKDTPRQIYENKNVSQPEKFVTISKLTAKVDSVCIQDGYQLYQHTIFVDKKSNWSVVQQGMNLETRYARRYHWFNKITSVFFSDDDRVNYDNKENSSFNPTELSCKNIIEPHTGIISQRQEQNVLNLVDKSCKKLQDSMLEYINIEKQDKIISTLKKIVSEYKTFSSTFFERSFQQKIKFPARHYILNTDIVTTKMFDNKKFYQTLCKIKDTSPKMFKDLVLLEGVGTKTLRALCLVSEVVFGIPASITDPARFSYAFGGKDGHPYPVDKKNYDTTISLLKIIVDKAKLGDKEKLGIMKRLATM